MTDQIDRIMTPMRIMLMAAGYRGAVPVVRLVLERELNPQAVAAPVGTALPPAGGFAPRPVEKPPSAPPMAAQQGEAAQGPGLTKVRKMPDPGIKYSVKTVKVSGKNPQYVGCYLECPKGERLYLRFTLNCNANAAKWGSLFLSFIRRLGLEEVTDSEQLVGRHLYFLNPKQVRNVQRHRWFVRRDGFRLSRRA